MKATQIMLVLAFGLPLAACDGDAAEQGDSAKSAKSEATSPAKDATKGEAKGEAKAEGAEAEPAADASEGIALNLDPEGRGLRGFDAVAYHAGAATAGSADHAASWSGAQWLFASAENKARFEAEPEKYAPQNGGFCTFGVVVGKKFDGDPQVWHLEDDKLYVFLNEEVKRKFLLDQAGNLEKVASNWPKIKDKSPEQLEAAE